MATDLIRYDLLVQEALRGVVRNVLSEAARNGLQGEHHFFITFKTTAPGLRLSNRMRERYPDEMTIILQHQFWDLGVTDHAFEVGLSFSNVPERLLIPFAAITSFVDPSVQFGLKFEVGDAGQPAGGLSGETPTAGNESVKALPARMLAAVDPVAKTPSTVPAIAAAAPQPAKVQDGKFGKPTLAKGTSKAPSAEADDKNGTKTDAKAGKAGDVTKVVSIDAFRKKP